MSVDCAKELERAKVVPGGHTAPRTDVELMDNFFLVCLLVARSSPSCCANTGADVVDDRSQVCLGCLRANSSLLMATGCGTKLGSWFLCW